MSEFWVLSYVRQYTRVCISEFLNKFSPQTYQDISGDTTLQNQEDECLNNSLKWIDENVKSRIIT